MRLIELVNGEIYERVLSQTNHFNQQEPPISRGKTKDLESVLSANQADTLVVVRKNLLDTAFNKGGLVDQTTNELRYKLSKKKIRSGRNLGLVVLSDPKQTWKDPKKINPFSYKFQRVDSIDATNSTNLLIRDLTDDSRIVLATPRQENLDEQIASIVDHFAQVIQSKSNISQTN
jgi:hypothetical protein